jgi:uncharacterized membrane-anchored protein
MSTPAVTPANTLWNKVPEVTLVFWIIKIMATTVGETAADFLNVNLQLGLSGTSIVTGALLLVALVFQMRARRHVPALYWLVVVLISIFGTLLTDNLVDNLGIAMSTITALFSACLLATFALWYARERTLSIHEVDSLPRESFYWAAILFTFALGTAAGDLMAEGLQWGYGLSALLFGGAIASVTLAWYRFRLNPVLAFWIAYVLTRPFGASCGDLLSQPVANGGLGLGTVNTSAMFLAAILFLVSYLAVQGRQARKPAP